MTSTEATKVEEKPLFEEKEVDQVAKKVKSIKAGSIIINPYDTTLNALVDSEGRIASQIYADGLGHVDCHARANYGVKKGRYYYEITCLDAQQGARFRIGFSTADAKWVGGDHSVAFNEQYRFRQNGEVEAAVKGAPTHYAKNDVVGVLLNLDTASANKNTVSLFVNGKRASEPKAISEDLVKNGLYPHVSYTRCVVGFHFEQQQKALPFTVSMIGTAPTSDLVKSKASAVDTPKAIFPVGLDTAAHVKEFCAKNTQYIELSAEYFKDWCKDSGYYPKSETSFGIHCFDKPELLSQWLRLREKNLIIALGCTLFKKERTAMCALVPNHTKSCLVLDSKLGDSATDKIYSNYEDAALPTEEEGFDSVEFNTSRDKEEENLVAWKKDQKLRSKVTDLKVGTWYGERIAEWTKFVTEKKTTEEGKLFKEEDWMLASLRVELMHIVQAFKDDVADEERPSFPHQLAAHYFKTYTKKHLNSHAFVCTSMEALIKEHVSDCVTVDEKGLLCVTLEKDIALEKIWELADVARERRNIRVFSGDEKSALKFNAQSAKNIINKPPQMQRQQENRYEDQEEEGHRQHHRHHHDNKRQRNYNDQHQRGQKRPGNQAVMKFGAPAKRREVIA